MANENFIPQFSTNHIYRNLDTTICLEDDLQIIESNISGKSDSDHNHDGDYAALSHTHSEYAAGTHNHDDLYAAKTHETNTNIHVTSTEKTDWNSKAAGNHNHDTAYAGINHAHADYAGIDHTHSSASTTTAGFISGADKAKLDGIEAGANLYTHPETHPASMITGLPTSLPADGGNADTVDNCHASDFASATHDHDSDYAAISHNHNGTYAAASHTHSEYSSTSHSHSTATTAAAGFMSGTDKAKLNGIAENANNYSHPSTHSVSMITETDGLKIMTAAERTKLSGIAENANNYTHPASHAASMITGLASVATSGSYNDLSNKPTIPAAYTHPSSHPASMITGLADVATSGSYNDLSNKPTIPAAYTHPSSHPASMITGLASVATSGSYTDLTNKPSTFTPAAHTHAQSEITGLETALSGKASTSHNHAITDVTGLVAALDSKVSLVAEEITEVGTDLNNYTTGGIFSFSVASSPLNMPSGVTNGWLIVMPWSENSGTIKQIFLRHGTTNSTDHFIYTRLHTNTAGWGNWSTVYTTGNPPTAAEVGAISKNLQMTSDTGDISISWSGKNVVTEFKNLASGMYTVYSPMGNTGNPNSTESFRFMCHKTGSVNYGWIMAYGAKGSVYTGYIDNTNWQGWKCIYDANPQPLWTGAQYMTEGHTVTPSKTLSECRNGWLLLWSDYDPGSGSNNTDFAASVIPKRAYTGQKWSGGQWYFDVPRYSAGSATDSEGRSIKLLLVHDTKIVGTENNDVAPRNDIVLRAVYEW